MKNYRLKNIRRTPDEVVDLETGRRYVVRSRQMAAAVRPSRPYRGNAGRSRTRAGVLPADRLVEIKEINRTLTRFLAIAELTEVLCKMEDRRIRMRGIDEMEFDV
jgi:hypothetical protein